MLRWGHTGCGSQGTVNPDLGEVREGFLEKENTEEKAQYTVVTADTAGLGKGPRNHRDVDSGL